VFLAGFVFAGSGSGRCWPPRNQKPTSGNRKPGVPVPILWELWQMCKATKVSLNFHSQLWNILIDRTSANKSHQALTSKKDSPSKHMKLLGIFGQLNLSTR
jgi:hypothetical protein